MCVCHSLSHTLKYRKLGQSYTLWLVRATRAKPVLRTSLPSPKSLPQYKQVGYLEKYALTQYLCQNAKGNLNQLLYEITYLDRQKLRPMGKSLQKSLHNLFGMKLSAAIVYLIDLLQIGVENSREKSLEYLIPMTSRGYRCQHIMLKQMG